MNLEESLRSMIRDELDAFARRQGKPRETAPADELLKAKEAAALLKTGTTYLYNNVDRFGVRLDKNVIRFSRNKILAEIARRMRPKDA